MKKLSLLLFIASLLFAVQEVPRNDQTNSNDKTNVAAKAEDKETPSQVQHQVGTEKIRDHFQDVDSNSVNDQRENDFQLIKSLNSKFKAFFNPSKSADSVNKTKEPRKQNRSNQK